MAEHHTLAEKIDDLGDYFARLKEGKTPIKIAFPPDSALLVVDVQRVYTAQDARGDLETERLAERINALVPLLREAGLPIYMIKCTEGARAEYTMDDHPDDTLVMKRNDSAFDNTKLAELLQQAGKKSLFLCGFNASACVADTAIDAIKNGFKPTVLADLTANDRLAGTYATDIETFFAANKIDICLARQHIAAPPELLPDTTLADETKRISQRKFHPLASDR